MKTTSGHGAGTIVEVLQSAFWRTNTGIITAPDDSVILIDPGVFPNELSSIAGRIGGHQLAAALSTHEDWDHVLWSPDLPTEAPRLAHPDTVRILEEQREHFLNELMRWEDDLGVSWDHDLVGRLQPIEANVITLAGISIRIVPTPGHTPGHTSLWLEDERVLFAGDMISDIDIPMLSSAKEAARTYLHSLQTLEPLIAQASRVIPGHGTPCDGDEASQRMAADRAYIVALLAGDPVNGTELRMTTKENREAHGANVATLGAVAEG
jgi:hydroxyacylglutathione hydrolase